MVSAHQQRVNAAHGGQRAQRLFTELVGETERENRRLRTPTRRGDDDKIAERQLERRKALGITGPEPLPHPDHIVTAEIHGPARCAA